MKSLIAGGVVIAALALAGTAAEAAGAPLKHTVKPHASHAYSTMRPTRAPAPQGLLVRYPGSKNYVDVGALMQSVFGGAVVLPDGRPLNFAKLFQNAGRGRVSRGGSGGSDWSPSYDSSPSVDNSVDNSASEAAIAASDAAIQSSNDAMAMAASNAAAEQQNDAANAATLQTEINAGM